MSSKFIRKSMAMTIFLSGVVCLITLRVTTQENNSRTIIVRVGEISIYEDEVLSSEEVLDFHARSLDLKPDSPELKAEVRKIEERRLSGRIEDLIIRQECSKRGITTSDKEVSDEILSVVERTNYNWATGQRLNKRLGVIRDALGKLHSGELTVEESHAFILESEDLSIDTWKLFVAKHPDRESMENFRLYEKADFENITEKSRDEYTYRVLRRKLKDSIGQDIEISNEEVENLRKQLSAIPDESQLQDEDDEALREYLRQKKIDEQFAHIVASEVDVLNSEGQGNQFLQNALELTLQRVRSL